MLAICSEEISLLKEEINRLKKLEEIASSYDKLKVQVCFPLLFVNAVAYVLLHIFFV